MLKNGTKNGLRQYGVCSAKVTPQTAQMHCKATWSGHGIDSVKTRLKGSEMAGTWVLFIVPKTIFMSEMFFSSM
jgi:hypothetical protein